MEMGVYRHQWSMTTRLIFLGDNITILWSHWYSLFGAKCYFYRQTPAVSVKPGEGAALCSSIERLERLERLDRLETQPEEEAVSDTGEETAEVHRVSNGQGGGSPRGRLGRGRGRS